LSTPSVKTYRVTLLGGTKDGFTAFIDGYLVVVMDRESRQERKEGRNEGKKEGRKGE